MDYVSGENQLLFSPKFLLKKMTDSTVLLDNRQRWSGFEKAAFCFCFIFFGLQIFPFPLSEIPVVGEFIQTHYENVWDKLINFSGKFFFGIPEITVKPNGSGDTTWNWVLSFLVVLLSTVGSFIWRILDRKRNNYNTLYFWNNIYIRYYLAITLFSYGIVKVFPAQFGTITSYRLHQELGDMSPMGLLWTFMAYSTSYQFFAGFMECLAAFLLLFRRTTLLGALISLGIMLNVFAMNMCFDVPVKLFSFFLVLSSIYIAAPNLQRLINFFILQKPTEAPPQYQPDFLAKKGFKITRIVLKTLLILGLIVPTAFQIMEEDEKREVPLTSFYGAYSVSKHVKNQAEMLITDSLRWEKLFVDRRGTRDMIYVSIERKTHFTTRISNL